MITQRLRAPAVPKFSKEKRPEEEPKAVILQGLEIGVVFSSKETQAIVRISAASGARKS